MLIINANKSHCVCRHIHGFGLDRARRGRLNFTALLQALGDAARHIHDQLDLLVRKPDLILEVASQPWVQLKVLSL